MSIFRTVTSAISLILCIVLFAVPAKAGDLEERISEAAGLINASSYDEAEDILYTLLEKDIPDWGRVCFLLGRLNLLKGDLDKAEGHLIKAAEDYPLLREYALSMLINIYVDSGQFEKALETSRQISNRLLQQEARKTEIAALIALERGDDVLEALSRYTKKYSWDWDYKMDLALMLKDKSNLSGAAALLKDIYLNAAPPSAKALSQLKALNADSFTREETARRAKSLYKRHDYRRAEQAYMEALKGAPEQEGFQIIYKIAMCQFRQKKYADSAKTFGRLGGPRSMYYRARSFYRIDDRKGFKKAKLHFEKTYPGNKDLALVFLMEAEEFRRQSRFDEAEAGYKKVLNGFSKSKEDALWGLGWMKYMSGDHGAALDYFSRLSVYSKSRDYYKYIYWRMRAGEKLFDQCKRIGVGICDKESYGLSAEIPSDNSFYGYLLKLRFPTGEAPGRIEISKPSRPKGEAYERIEALAILGMRDEAAAEISASMRRSKKLGEFMYLGYMSMQLEEYKRVIAFAEPKKRAEFLPYSYPLGYWDIVSRAAGNEDLDAHLIAALIREESRFEPSAISWAGAVGLMQLMPSTARRLKKGAGVHFRENSELQDAEINIPIGAYYLSQLIDEFRDVPLAIAAYNAGENTLKGWIVRFDRTDPVEFIENIPYKETRRYVKKVLKSYWQYRTINGLSVDAYPVLCMADCGHQAAE